MQLIAGTNRSPLVITGGAQTLTFKPSSEFVAGSYRITPHTEVKDSELVFVGYGINAPELGWNDYAGIDMKGKTAVILVNDPDYAMDSEEGLFRGRRMTYYGRWTYKFEEAARRGAVGARDAVQRVVRVCLPSEADAASPGVTWAPTKSRTETTR